jgi:hypothetical protein
MKDSYAITEVELNEDEESAKSFRQFSAELSNRLKSYSSSESQLGTDSDNDGDAGDMDVTDGGDNHNPTRTLSYSSTGSSNPEFMFRKGDSVRIVRGRLCDEIGTVLNASNGWIQLTTNLGEIAKRAHDLKLIEEVVGPADPASTEAEIDNNFEVEEGHDLSGEQNEESSDEDENVHNGHEGNSYDEPITTTSRRGRRKKRGRTGWRGRPYFTKRPAYESSFDTVGWEGEGVLSGETGNIEADTSGGPDRRDETGPRFLITKLATCSRVGENYQADLGTLLDDVSVVESDEHVSHGKMYWRPQELDDSMFQKYMELAKLHIFSRKIDVLLALTETLNTVPIVDGAFLLLSPFVDSTLTDLYYEK